MQFNEVGGKLGRRELGSDNACEIWSRLETSNAYGLWP